MGYAFERIFHKFRRDETLAFQYPVIMTVNLSGKQADSLVYLQRVTALSGGPASAFAFSGLSDSGINRNFCPYLFIFTVDTQAAK